MTAGEYAAKAINERGYLIIASRKALAKGDNVTDIFVDHEPLPHPFTVAAETTLADYLQQQLLLFGTRARLSELDYHFYRVTTD